MSSQPAGTGLASLTSHLQSLAPADGSRRELFGSVIPAVIDAVGDIARALQKAHQVALAGTANTFGDDQLNVDVVSEKILRDAFAAKCPSVVTASSEEDPVERRVHADGSNTAQGPGEGEGGGSEIYTVGFDPLDGSSIIAPNWSVGTILGVWDGETAVGQPAGSGQVAAVLGVYGPRTTAVVAVRIPGAVEPACFEVGLRDHGARDAEVIRSVVRLAEAPFKTRYFAPANCEYLLLSF